MPSSTLVFRVNTPDGLLIEEEGISSITVPLASGYPIGIRPGHARLIAETQKGKVRLHSAQNEQQYELHAGVLTIWNDVVTILTAGEAKNLEDSISSTDTVKGNRLLETLGQKFTNDEEPVSKGKSKDKQTNAK
jgi:F0F1-type ATP synthase epsilon subunit